MRGDGVDRYDDCAAVNRDGNDRGAAEFFASADAPLRNGDFEADVVGNAGQILLLVEAAYAAGLEVSDLFPRLAGVADHLTGVKSLSSEVFNHGLAVNLLNTGDSIVGRPTMGAWMSYGLGNLSEDPPAHVVLTSGIKQQPLLNSHWSSGFLPRQHQGVKLRSSGGSILFLSNL